MAIYSPSGASAAIGFSIPVDTVRRVVNQIIRHGRVVRPTMGVNVEDDRVLRSIAMQLRREMNGVLVVEVLPGSPAETAGLRATELRSDDRRGRRRDGLGRRGFAIGYRGARRRRCSGRAYSEEVRQASRRDRSGEFDRER